tara:strand:- start:506 stop:1630 length:1125 start_codon:yes stop_codon:yes gene_type:complete
MKYKINRSWRRWKNDDTRSPRAVVGSEGGPVRYTASQATNVASSSVKKVKRNFAPAKLNATSDKIYDAGKELYNNNEIVNAKNLQQNQKPIYTRYVVDDYLDGLHKKADKLYDDKEFKKAEALDKEARVVDNFLSALDYSSHTSAFHSSKPDGKTKFQRNERAAHSLGVQYFKSRNKRYGTAFANLIAKLAEDNSGNDVDGDEFWDEQLLAERTVTRHSINKCKKDKTKERIVLMLDTSPSCRQVANFYGLMANIAEGYDDIEVYDVPNGRIVHKYSRRYKRFVPAWNLEDIINGAHEWKYMKNRTVLIFSDSDCTNTVEKNIGINNAIILCHCDETDAYSLRDIKTKLENKGGKIFYGVDSPDKLMEVVRKLK